MDSGATQTTFLPHWTLARRAMHALTYIRMSTAKVRISFSCVPGDAVWHAVGRHCQNLMQCNVAIRNEYEYGIMRIGWLSHSDEANSCIILA